MNQADAKKILNLEFDKAEIFTGDVVLVHSSLRRLLKKLKSEFALDASPENIFNILLERLTERGTLILPLFNFDFPNTKTFDIRETPSQMGVLTELGRLYPNAIRTGHPIYSFAVIGKEAHSFKDIYNFSGYGADSPFNIIKKLDGKIAVIGLDDQNSMTSYHFVEEMHQVDYRYHKKFSGEYIDWDGSSTQREFGLFVRDLERGVQTDVNRMGELLWQKGLYKGTKFDRDFGIRSVKFNDFYQCVSEVIVKGEAENYLYSIKEV